MVTVEPINDYNNIYIYKKMTKESGHDIVKGYLSVNNNNFEEIKPIVWLIRESNQEGMLTIDYAFFAENCWDTYSRRFLLTPMGWIEATNLTDPEVQKSSESMITIDSNTAKEYLPQWENFVANQGFDTNYRINPKIDEQTTNEIYSSYDCLIGMNLNAILNLENKAILNPGNKVILNPGITQAISCELTKEPFRKPVIMKNDLQINNTLKLYKGRSYEESALIDLNVPEETYCPNLTLKEVVNRLGSLIKEKMETLTEDKLTDSIIFDSMEGPVVLPSGQSINDVTWYQLHESTNKCPHTREPLGEILPNVNLRAFIVEWDLYKETFLEKLGQDR